MTLYLIDLRPNSHLDLLEDRAFGVCRVPIDDPSGGPPKWHYRSKYHRKRPNRTSARRSHGRLEGGGCVTQPEWHYKEFVMFV